MSDGLVDALRRKVNKSLGYDIVRCAGQHTLRAHISQILEKYDINAVIDVGANEGNFGRDLRRSGFQGHIYSFEPVAQAFAVLQTLAEKGARWQAFNFALGARHGEITINVSRFSQFSSLLEPNEFGLTWGNMKVEDKQQVLIKTLMQCFDDGTLPRASRYLLKMDTQGYDLEVFKGAGSALDSVVCMLSELSLIPIYHRMPHYLDVLAEYEKSGFLVTGMYPITRNVDLTLNEIDCMLVNSRVINSR